MFKELGASVLNEDQSEIEAPSESGRSSFSRPAMKLLKGKRIKIWSCYPSDNSFSNRFDGEIVALYKNGIGVKVSNGEIVITEIQPEGKGRMSVSDYLNGLQNKESLIGDIFQ